MEKNPYEPDFQAFLKFVEDELDYLESFDLSADYGMLQAAAACVTLRAYLKWRLS